MGNADRKTLFSERALNNLLYHRRQLRVVVLTKGDQIRYVTIDKKKDIKRKTAHFDALWFRFVIVVRPTSYKPTYIMHRGSSHDSRH